MSSGRHFFPKADASVLSQKLAPPPDYPQSVGPIYDCKNVDTPVLPWDAAQDSACYPRQQEKYAPAIIPKDALCSSDRYLRATLAKNERLRLSMLWYYTCDIFKETEFLSGLQEKVCIAQESADWEFAIIGILDVNFYIRLATIGVPLGILPRGETLCAHTVVQPPGCVFLLPSLMEDWRFATSPYVESGGLLAYAGAPLRLQHESGETVCLGSLCVASSTSRDPLTRAQQTTLIRLADWIVHDMVQVTRARRQRERRRMVDLIAVAQKETDDSDSETPVMQALRTVYPGAVISLQTSREGHIAIEGRSSIALSDLSDGLWEDSDYIDEFILLSNHLELPSERVVRVIAAPCESVSGPCFLVVGTRDFRLVFDDVDAWFLQTCASIVSQMWHQRLFREVMVAKEKFLRGFSHQLRTPVHGILGSVELLAEELNASSLGDAKAQTLALLESTSGLRSSGETKVFLDTIKRAGQDLISIINSMITLNRWADVASAERHYAEYTISDLERQLANDLQTAISWDSRYNASILFDLNQLPDNYSVHTDLTLFRDSVLPLIVNAIQNTTEGFVIITFSARPEPDELVVDVKDTGRGIAVNDQQRIFELYEQKDAYSTGAGLGLTLASRFASLLKGSVELISSEVDKGSHFRATFKDVAMACRNLSTTIVSLDPPVQNVPKYFHIIHSSPKNALLCDHFGKFLGCHGLISSDKIEDALVVIDFVPSSEQYGATLSRVPSGQVIICLVPSSKPIPYPDDALKNVVYVNGPFLTSTMALALRQADNYLATFASDQVSLAQSIQELTLRTQQTKISSGYQNETELVVKNVASDNPAGLNQACITHEHSRSNESDEVGGSSDPGGTSNQASRVQFEAADPSPSTTDKGSLDIKPDVAAPETAEIFAEKSIDRHSLGVLPHPSTTSRPTCLLVDDNDINLRLLQMYCSKRNLPYLCAKDGLEAVSLFQSHQEASGVDKTKAPIQLILMDLQMPVCDGVEATKRIRQLERENGWGQSVLFVVTGQDSAADREAAAKAGGQEYYVKPVSVKSWDAGLKQYFPCFEAF